MGRPTEMFDFMVESKETSTHFAASFCGVAGEITRSSMGLPYFDSPSWKKGVSSVASMKLPCA